MGTVTLDHRFSKDLSLRNMTRYGATIATRCSTPPRPATTVADKVPEIRATTRWWRRSGAPTQVSEPRRPPRHQPDGSDGGVQDRRIEHDTDIGLEFAHDHQPTYAVTDLFTNGRPPVNDLFNPTPSIAYTPALAPTGATSDAHATTSAIYAFDAIKLSDRWRIDLGLPALRSRRGRLHDAVGADCRGAGRRHRGLRPTDNAPADAPAGLQTGGARHHLRGVRTSFTPSFDGTLGLTLAATGVNNQALPPEKSYNAEAGTKWDLTPNLQFTAAVFDTQKTNAKTTDENGATVLLGDQEVKGVEFGLSGNLTPRWGAFGGLSLMDGTVNRSNVAYEVGQQLAYVPHVTFNLWSTYRLPMGLTLGGGTNYSDGNYFNQTGGFLYVAGGTVPQTKYVANAAAVQALTKYWLFNAVAMYTVNKHLLLQLNATNLTDAKCGSRLRPPLLPGPTRQVVFSPVITW